MVQASVEPIRKLNVPQAARQPHVVYPTTVTDIKGGADRAGRRIKRAIKRVILPLGHAPPPPSTSPIATLNGILLRDAPIEPIYGDGDDVDAPPELHASSRRWEPNRLTNTTIPTKTAKDDTTLTQPVACFYPVGFVFDVGVRLLFL